MDDIRKLLKLPFYRLIDTLLASRYVTDRRWLTGRELFAQGHARFLPAVSLPPPPPAYGLSLPSTGKPPAQTAPIFITARFRSGSTFLWQLFRQLDNTTCYYEPLNEARWFKKDSRNARVDATHIGVDDYRTEYAGMDDLDRIFDSRWALHGLYMDETHHNPGMKRYLSELIHRAKGRAVLQFNRADFRLPWLRAHFPQAKVVHLYRHPREQWMSIVGKGGGLDPAKTITPDEITASDGFYTVQWARDLRHVFPLLEPAGRHPYELHYLLWRLSYAYGCAYSDVSIGYEELVSDFERTASAMFEAVGIRDVDLASLASLNHGSSRVRWPEYAGDAWFGELETRCESDLQAFFSNTRPAGAN